MPYRIPFILLEKYGFTEQTGIVVVVSANNTKNIVFPVLLFSSFLFLDYFELMRNAFIPSPMMFQISLSLVFCKREPAKVSYCHNPGHVQMTRADIVLIFSNRNVIMVGVKEGDSFGNCLLHVLSLHLTCCEIAMVLLRR
jgi:hypothetical protein